VKQFAFQIVELVVPLVQAKIRVFGQMRAAITAIEEKMEDELHLTTHQHHDEEAQHDLESHPSDRRIEMTLRKCELEYQREEYPGVYLDYKELALQFGYASLSAVAFPLAPLLSIVNNIIEVRADAFKLCNVHQRYRMRQCQDIGQWQTVFTTISVMSILTNALLMGFVGSQLQFYIQPSVHQDGTERMKNHKMWAMVIIIEHVVLVVRWFLDVLIPKTPQWVRFAKMKVLAKQKEAGMTDTIRKELSKQQAEFDERRKEREARSQAKFDERRKVRRKEDERMHRSTDENM